jgi:hypothetical protein
MLFRLEYETMQICVDIQIEYLDTTNLTRRYIQTLCYLRLYFDKQTHLPVLIYDNNMKTLFEQFF